MRDARILHCVWVLGVAWLFLIATTFVHDEESESYNFRVLGYFASLLQTHSVMPQTTPPADPPAGR